MPSLMPGLMPGLMLAQPTQHSLAFSLHTVADTQSGSALYGLDDLDAADAARAMQQLRLQQGGQTQLLPHLRKIQGIAVAGYLHGRFCVHNLDASQGETSLIADFCRRLDAPSSTLYGYEIQDSMAVLHCRGLIQRATGTRKIPLDLADALTGAASAPPLNELMQLLGLPTIDAGLTQAQICALRAVQIYLLVLRQQHFNASLDAAGLASAEQDIRTQLGAKSEPLWQEFLRNWPAWPAQ